VQDLYKPEGPRLRKHLSAILNFAMFREEKLAAYTSMQEQLEGHLQVSSGGGGGGSTARVGGSSGSHHTRSLGGNSGGQHMHKQLMRKHASRHDVGQRLVWSAWYRPAAGHYAASAGAVWSAW
jgi:hypothetical protein